MLVISKVILQSIRAEGRRTYPNECCGAILGYAEENAKRVASIYPIENAREDEEQYHRFVIMPEDFMRAERIARDQKLDIVGFYHSHPDHPAYPSEYDREHAFPFYSYIIVSIEGGEGKIEDKELTSWELNFDREFTPEEITEENV